MGTIRLPTDFRDFLKLLNSEGVEYLVVGGYAVAYHGHPRATGDLDVWISSQAGNLERVMLVLRKFGFSEESVEAAMRVDRGRVIRMGVPPLRIELLTAISGVVFTQCHSRRQLQSVEDVDVAFISLEDLLANKRAAGRAKDVADLEALA